MAKKPDYFEQRDDMFGKMDMPPATPAAADAGAEAEADDDAKAKKLAEEMGMSPEDMARGEAAGAQTDQILSESEAAEPDAAEAETVDLAPLATALKKDEAYAQKFLDAANSLPEYGDVDPAALADIVKTDFNAKKSIMLAMTDSESEMPEVAPASKEK